MYNKEAKNTKNKGPIIVCVDTSASMRGKSELWSKAVVVAVAEIAKIQNRDFACIIFSCFADEPIVIHKGEHSPEKLLDCAEIFHGAGTDFMAPLKKAMDVLNESRFTNADILFIADGEFYFWDDDFLKKYHKVKNEKGFRTLGVLIDIDGLQENAYMKEKGSMNKFCDSITLLSDIAELKDSESKVNRFIFGNL